MVVLLNFLPLKTGGGVQVALDFINQVSQSDLNIDWHLVARKDTPFECNSTVNQVVKSAHYVKDSLLHRLTFEFYGCKRILEIVKPDLVYTQFGPHWPAAKKYINVVGCAYSNLFYPEIDFWKGCGFYSRPKRFVIDFFRKSRLKTADHVIFETEDLAERSVKQNVLRKEKVSCVKPAVSSYISRGGLQNRLINLINNDTSGFKMCLISSYSINKNFPILLESLYVMRTVYGVTDVYLILTLPENEKSTKRVLREATALGVSEQVVNLGRIPFDACSDVYRLSDCAILPANLESFSNNIAESWKTETPLVITDADWSRRLCGSGALYIDKSKADDIAKNVLSLRNNLELRQELIKNGCSQLAKYPTSQERYFRYVDALKSVYAENLTSH